MSGNAKSECLMTEFTTMRYDNIGSVREYILKMVHLQTKLQSLKIDLLDSFLMPHALNSLPAEFFQIKTVYNTLNETQSINDLIIKYVVEEEKLKKEKREIAFLFFQSKSYFGKDL